MSDAEFTPDTPCVVGLQWMPVGLPLLLVAGDIADKDTLEHVVESTATETVDSVAYFVDAGAGSPLDLQALDGLYSVEVYDADNLGTDTATVTQYAPDVDVGSFNLLRWDGAAFQTSSYFSGVDDLTTFTPGTYGGYGTLNATFIAPGNGGGSLYEFQCSGIVGSLTGEQVMAIRVVAIVDQLTQGNGAASASFVPYIVTTGLRSNGSAVTISGGQPRGRRIESTWYANPRTGCPWTINDAEEFAAGLHAGGIEILPNGDPFRLPVVYSTFIEILHRPEPRLAFGCLSEPAAGWNEITLTKPDTTSGWAKVNGDRYLVALRKRGGQGRLVVPYMFTDDTTGILPPVTYGVFTTYGVRSRQPTGWSHDAHDDATAGLVMVVGAGVSVDSQPYATFGYQPYPAIGEPGYVGFLDATHVFRQEITAPTTDDYGFVRLLASLAGGVPLNGPISVTLKTTANAVLAGPLTFDFTDMVAPFDQLQILSGQFATPATLTNGVTYWLEITSTATDGFWLVQTLTTFSEAITGGPSAGSMAETAGGLDGLIVDGVGHDWIDAAITLHVLPDPITGLAAVGTTGAEPLCSTQPSVDVSWTAWTPNCGTFAFYELQRSRDGGITWQTIATITDSTAVDVTDSEPAVNVEVSYRVRVGRADGAVSDWSDEETATAASDCCGYWFSSNVAPTFSVWYDDIGPSRPYTFLENATTVQLDDRDFQVGFRELEDRGDQFAVTLLVADDSAMLGTTATATPGRRTFDPLLVLAGNKRDRATGDKVTVPYICVRTADGDVWYATLRFPRDGVRTETGGNYTLDVTVTEVTDTPYPFDVTGP